MTKFNARGRVSLIAMVTVLAAGLAGAPAWAQTPSAADAPRPKLHFSIPPGPLAPALNRFAELTGIQLVYPSSLVQGLSSPGLSGDFTPADALQRLVAGTGLSARMLSATSATLEPSSVGGARTLGAVRVEGDETNAFPVLNGFGAGAGSNGSSDPAATEGTGSLTTNGAVVASRAAQSLKDTPQTVSVITAERIQQQNLTDMLSALNSAPGITLEETSSISTTFISRGFTITSFQLDGGAALDLGYQSTYSTTPNLAEFDNVQVLRGSDGLFGGTGNPGAVVDLERKRPLDHEQVLVDVEGGSWNNYRVQADATGPIAFDGHLRARFVVSDQDRDFFFDRAHQNKPFVYGVLEGDLGPDTILRAGASFEHQTNTAFDKSGLPRYVDGSDLGLPRSTSLNAQWNYLTTNTPEFFAALDHRFNSDWQLKLSFTRLAQNAESLSETSAGNIFRGSPSTSTYGAEANSYGVAKTDQNAGAATLNGHFKLFGLDQTLTAGWDYSNNSGGGTTYQNLYSFVPIDVFSFNPASLNPPPTNLPLLDIQPDNTFEQWGGYVTMNSQPVQNLHLIGGTRFSNYRQTDLIVYYDGLPTPIFQEYATNAAHNIITPYGAVDYDLTKTLSLYASYADIFQPQASYLDPTGKPLPPVTGATYESGIKGAFKGGRLTFSASVYYSDQSNQAILYPGPCSFGGSGCYLDSGGVISKGVDLELTGEILPGWQVQASYDFNINQYNAAFLNATTIGLHNRTYQSQQPRSQVKLWTSYTPIGRFNRWTVSGGLRLESTRYTLGAVCSVALNEVTGACPTNVYLPFNYSQGLYTVADLRAGYKFNKHWQAALNLTNIGDTRYWTTSSFPTGENFYGEPRAFMLSIRASY